jgi:hypothetical protein
MGVKVQVVRSCLSNSPPKEGIKLRKDSVRPPIRRTNVAFIEVAQKADHIVGLILHMFRPAVEAAHAYLPGLGVLLLLTSPQAFAFADFFEQVACADLLGAKSFAFDPLGERPRRPDNLSGRRRPKRQAFTFNDDGRHN